MTRGEREDLQRLIRQREKVLKSKAKQRSAELVADFEGQLAAKYSFDSDETWAAANREAEAEVEKANQRIAARAAALGIPKTFAPRLIMHWRDRGETAVKERRAEMRKAAVSRIETIERDAIVQIELGSVALQTELATAGVTSEAAREFFGRLATVESLMPALTFDEIAGQSDPPVVERLLSNTAERQRRYRERHRDARVTSSRNDPDPEALT